MRLRDDRGIDKSCAVWYDARIIRKGRGYVAGIQVRGTPDGDSAIAQWLALQASRPGASGGV